MTDYRVTLHTAERTAAKAAELMQVGDTTAGQQQYKEAAQHYRLALQSFPLDRKDALGTAVLKLADCLVKAGEGADVMALYQRWVGNRWFPHWAKSQLWKIVEDGREGGRQKVGRKRPGR